MLCLRKTWIHSGTPASFVLRRSKIGCPDKFVNVIRIRSFHDGMLAHVIDCGDISAAFSATSGTKLGCIFRAELYALFLAIDVIRRSKLKK